LTSSAANTRRSSTNGIPVASWTCRRGLHLFLLPAHTPELQPAERLWPLLHESVVNRPFDDLATLQTVLVARCAHLTTQQTTVKGLTNYHWWPQQ
jgi:hypothetical protein